MRLKWHEDNVQSAGEPGVSASTSFAGGFILSVVLGFGILVTLIYVAGPWDFLAVTRVLDLLIEGGIVQYHDRNPGFIAGLPDVGYYLMARDPIDWRLVFIAAILMMIYPSIKAAQFDRIARVYGSTGTFGEHMRAYFYGDGLDRVLPFNIGKVATATALTKLGLSEERAAGAVFVSLAFTVFEISMFALIGLFLLGWAEWFSLVIWSLVFLAAAIYLVRNGPWMSAVPPTAVAVRGAMQAFHALAQRMPGLFVQLCALSLAAFGILDIAVYTVLNAFDTVVVLMAVEAPLLLMALVGGYIAARLVPVTPGGIGQWELGFGTGLYLGGADVSLALVAVGLLANVLRIITGLTLMGGAMMYGTGTNLREVLSVFMRRPRPALAWEQEAEEEEKPPAEVTVA